MEVGKLCGYSKFTMLIALVVLLSACGGGGSSDSSQSAPAPRPSPVPTPEPADTSPDDFSLAPVRNALLGAIVESESISVSGIDAPTPISVDGGEYSINAGPYTAQQGMVNAGQNVRVRLQSSASLKSESSSKLSIGDKSSEFIVRTASSYITELRKLGGGEIQAGVNLVAFSQCQSCDADKTLYEWYRGDGDTPVATAALYEVTQADTLASITLKATPFDSEGVAGRTESATYLRRRVKDIVGNQSAFAALFTDGSVETWGRRQFGGDSSIVRDELVGVEEIYHSSDSFAARRNDGSIVLWGQGTTGEVIESNEDIRFIYSGLLSAMIAVNQEGKIISLDGRSIRDMERMENVAKIFSKGSDSTGFAAALNDEGKVSDFGITISNGQYIRAPENYGEVSSVVLSRSAFAAIQSDGSVFTWGRDYSGADSSEVAAALTNIKDVKATERNFVALNEEGSLITWGPSIPSDISFESSAQQLNNLKDIASSSSAFAALTEDGAVVTWGSGLPGGNQNETLSQLNDIVSIQSNQSAFAAVSKSGAVVTWGVEASGGNSADYQDDLINVEKVISTQNAFSALREDGSVILWGDELSGGQSRDIAPYLTDIVSIVATERAYAALRADGSVITWGSSAEGGRGSTGFQSYIEDVKSLHAGNTAFAAIKNDGTIFIWGDSPIISGSVGFSEDPAVAVAFAGDVFAFLTESGKIHRPSHSNEGVFYDTLEGTYRSVVGNNPRIFSAISKDNGAVKIFGNVRSIDNKALIEAETNVRSITPGPFSFIAVKEDGSTLQWGSDRATYETVVDKLNNVRSVVASQTGFSALKEDNTVVSWGRVEGDPFQHEEANVKYISASGAAFAALKIDGSVVTWGDRAWGGNSDSVQARLVDVVSIASTTGAFSAVTASGQVVNWGRKGFGGGENDFTATLTGVEEIVGARSSFAALKSDGTVVTWGDTVSLNGPDFTQEDILVRNSIR